jgi:hemolysin D
LSRHERRNLCPWRTRRRWVIQPRVDVRKLMDKDLGSKLNYFEILQLLVEQQEEFSVQRSHLHAAEAAVAAIRAQ